MVDLFEQELSKLNFPNYQKYNEINEACNDLIQKIMIVIDKVAPIKKAGETKLSGLMGKFPIKLKL